MRKLVTIHHALAAIARDRAGAPAILAPERQPLSYAMLWVQIGHLGDELAAQGLGKGSRVGVVLPHSPEAAVAVVGIMSWATCCPINPELDENAYRTLLACLQVDAVLVLDGEETPATNACRSLGLQILRLRPSGTGAAGRFSLDADVAAATGIAPRQPDADDVAIVLHTSGTTSTPKVVPVTQAQWLWRIGRGRLTSRDRCLCTGPLFASGVLTFSLTEPLCVGAGVIVCPDASSASILRCVEVFAPTCYSANPALHRSVLEALAAGATLRNQSLRFVRSSSGPLPEDLHRRLEKALAVPVIQGYGMTETGVIAQNPLPPARSIPGSVGLPGGADVRIVDSDGTPQPANVHGEVAVRGPGVMSGYENAPDANQRAFRGGWFMTGDVGYQDDDGYLFLVGRIKELINRGGLKLSPTEVDEALALHPAVREAAAFGVPHPTLGEDVAAAVTLREHGAASEEDLRAFALARLAPHKVPNRIVIVDALPRNALGKVMRGELMNRFGQLAAVPYQAPRNSLEELVATLFGYALGTGAKVGIHDNFFQLGGDSLRGAQVTSRANATLHLDLGPKSLFEHPTVAQFACHLESAHGPRDLAPPLVPRTRRPTELGEAQSKDKAE
jgi:oxalate---CoA ligase